MTSLDELLADLRVAAAAPLTPRAVLFYARHGSGVLLLPAGKAVAFSPRTLVLLPPGVQGRVQPDGDTSPGPAATRSRTSPSGVEWTYAGAGLPRLELARIGVQATYEGSLGLFDQLREPLVERPNAGHPLCRAVEDLLDELHGRRPGFRPMVEALLRRCIILFLRRHCARGERRLSWLAAAEDPGLSRALAAIRDRPARAHTVATLAEIAGMSRSRFAVRFMETFRRSPMALVKTVRLAYAAELLSQTEAPVKSIGARIGYSSRSSFSRAFSARYGMGPAEFRAAGLVTRPLRPR